MMLKRKVPIVLMTAAALTLTACAQSDRDSGNTGIQRQRPASRTRSRSARPAPPSCSTPSTPPTARPSGSPARSTRACSASRRAARTSQPELAESWTPSADGLSLDVQAQAGREVLRRRAVQRRGRLRQLRPDVQPEGRGPDRGRVLGLLLRLVQRQARGLAVQVVQGPGRGDRGHQHHPVDLELPDDPVARLLLDAVAQGDDGR